jgi:hypothetical protein
MSHSRDFDEYGITVIFNGDYSGDATLHCRDFSKADATIEHNTDGEGTPALIIKLPAGLLRDFCREATLGEVISTLEGMT